MDLFMSKAVSLAASSNQLHRKLSQIYDSATQGTVATQSVGSGSMMERAKSDVKTVSDAK